MTDLTNTARGTPVAFVTTEQRKAGPIPTKFPQQTVHLHRLKQLMVSTGTDVVAARELLDQAEQRCLIANSLRGSRILEAQVIAQDA